MQIGNKFRCHPTTAQAKILLQWIGCQRNIYNAKVREDQYFRRFAHKSLNHTGQYAPIDQQYSQFKSELTPYLSEVPSVLLRNGAVLWKQAYGRYFSKLGGRPTIHNKHGKQSVWLTSELFKFVPMVDTNTGEITGYQLHIGIKKFPVGLLAFKAHKAFKPPASLHVSIHGGRWHVSFNYDNNVPEPTDKDTMDWLTQFDEVELRKMTVGLDRGVTLPLAGSDYQQFDFTPPQKQQLLKQERHKKRWQRRQARRVLGSSGWLKAKRRVASYQRYGADVRRDVAHKTSHALSTNPRYKLYVFEALKVKNMTKKPKPKQDAQGKYIRNGATAKSGLNKSILASTWGQTKTYLQYKACRQGKLVIEVSPFYSSQECAACGHVHQDNRVSQAEFVCLSCGNTDHADHNAAKVIALRGVKQLLAGKCIQKEKKRCRITRSKVGAEGSKLVAEMQSTLSETEVSRMGGNTPTLWSLTLETPATTPVFGV
ncbi:MAG: transposase [Betaproteobacteria bacterium]